MPEVAVVHNKLEFDCEGCPIKVLITFETLLLCTYVLTLREAKSNKTVVEYEGDNTNPEDDTYTLPVPAKANKDRNLFLHVAILDQTKKGGDYQIDLKAVQDGKTLKGSPLSSGKKKMKGNIAAEILVATLTC